MISMQLGRVDGPRAQHVVCGVRAWPGWRQGTGACIARAGGKGVEKAGDDSLGPRMMRQPVRVTIQIVGEHSTTQWRCGIKPPAKIIVVRKFSGSGVKAHDVPPR